MMPEYNDAHLLEFERAGRITASLVGAILGCDPYTSWQEAWRRILGIGKPRPTNKAQAWGLDHEADALEAFEVESGFLVSPGRFIPHPEVPWLGASPDGMTSNGFPVEVKCPQKLHESIPLHYELQVLTQCECARKTKGYFVSWTPTQTNWWPVHFDKERWLNDIYPRLEEFYTLYVVTKTEPPRRKRNAG